MTTTYAPSAPDNAANSFIKMVRWVYVSILQYFQTYLSLILHIIVRVMEYLW